MAGGRIALAIGNSNYHDIHIPLRTPRNDAQDVAGALQQLGFEVDLSLDANKKSMDAAFARFARAATNAELALFFYAGHSVEFRGENYLVPTDAELKDEVSVLYEMVSIENLRAALDHIKGVRIMIVDACRNNPLAEKLQNSLTGPSRLPMRGTADIEQGQGTVIVFSTGPDQVMQEGKGRNSRFTASFLKRMQEPSLEIGMMLRRISKDVNAETGGQQRPETYISLQTEYYLNQR